MWTLDEIVRGIGRDGHRIPNLATSIGTPSKGYERQNELEQEFGHRLELLAPEEPWERKERLIRERQRRAEVDFILGICWRSVRVCFPFRPLGRKRLGQPMYPRYEGISR